MCCSVADLRRAAHTTPFKRPALKGTGAGRRCAADCVQTHKAPMGPCASMRSERGNGGLPAAARQLTGLTPRHPTL